MSRISRLPSKYLLGCIITLSLAIKIGLFAYTAINAPDSKFMPDTATYLEPGANLLEKGIFATYDDNGNILYEVNRTPGYPIFLAFLNRALGIPFDGIILIQILLMTGAGFMVYKAAKEIDSRTGLLAAFIFLFDQPTSLSALMLLTEALYTVFIACFIYLFLRYLKEYKIGLLLLSVIVLALATYIRPVSYYLGIFLPAGVLYSLFRHDLKKAVIHALSVLVVFYSLLGIWHYRNYLRTGNADFTVIDDRDLNHMGITHHYARYRESEDIKAHPFLHYTHLTAKSIIQFFTLPGTFKYLESRPLRAASKILGYPWMVFWLIGFLFAGWDSIQKKFLLSTILYFMLVSIMVTGLCVGSRFRVPVMPLLSILSASGWMKIIDKYEKAFR